MLIGIIFLFKLFFLQVLDPNYKLLADNNIITRKVEYPLRGQILDRHGKLVVNNRPVFEINIVPRELVIKDTSHFCEIFDVTVEELRRFLVEASEYSKVKPSIFIRQMRIEEFAKVQDHLVDYPGVSVVVRTIREYPSESMANVLGYVKEVDTTFLRKDTTGYYRRGDLVGKTGIEAFYEPYLRGRRGVRYVMTNVRGVEKGKFRNGEFDTLPLVGENLVASLDLDLQQYGEQLMRNKKGAIVAIEPESGEILVMISAPSYDPNLLTGEGRQVTRNYMNLLVDPHKPLFNRAYMSPYPPGSTYKTIMALIGLQDGTLDSVHTSYPCIQDVVKCHRHPSPLNLHGSIQHSCNPFYLRAFRAIMSYGKGTGSERGDMRASIAHWQERMNEFGLGIRMGIDLPYEQTGLIPGLRYYDRRFRGENWKLSNIYSISIGQGEVGVLPVQLANVAATIANRGWYITPHVIKGIGQRKEPLPQYVQRHQTSIHPAYFEFVVDAMADVVRAGTARRAIIPDIVVCGKTGTAQNPHGEDHSVFMAFAPKQKPKIAIAAYVENAGFGGTWAAPIASLIMEKYLTGEVKRKDLEKQIMEANLMNVKPKQDPRAKKTRKRPVDIED